MEPNDCTTYHVRWYTNNGRLIEKTVIGESGLREALRREAIDKNFRQFKKAKDTNWTDY